MKTTNLKYFVGLMVIIVLGYCFYLNKNKPEISFDTKANLPALKGDTLTFHFKFKTTNVLKTFKVIPIIDETNEQVVYTYKFDENLNEAVLIYNYVVPNNLKQMNLVALQFVLNDNKNETSVLETISVYNPPQYVANEFEGEDIYTQTALNNIPAYKISGLLAQQTETNSFIKFSSNKNITKYNRKVKEKVPANNNYYARNVLIKNKDVKGKKEKFRKELVVSEIKKELPENITAVKFKNNTIHKNELAQSTTGVHLLNNIKLKN